MKTKFLFLFTLLSVAFLSFDLPKNQQPQQLGSPYYAELRNKHVVSADAKIGFIPTRYANSDAEFMMANSKMSILLSNIDSVFISQGIKKLTFTNQFKEHELPEMFFGTIGEGLDVPMFVDRTPLEGLPNNRVVLAAYKGKKKFTEQLQAVMNSEQLDYVIVPCLRETLIYPSAPLKERGIFSSTTASAKNYFIDLGTNNVIKGDKIQSLNDPIGVLVLCAGLMNKEGKVVSIVSEGIVVAKQSSFVEQVLNIRTLFAPSDINAVINSTRDDLADTPLVWSQATLNALMHLRQQYKAIPTQKYMMLHE
ncbi:MAG: hypothetical protein ACK45U_02260 [bacterium]|jgi:hypothetical protein